MKTSRLFGAATLLSLLVVSPLFTQPPPPPPVLNGHAAGTCYSDSLVNPFLDGFVVGVIDVRNANNQTTNTNWMPPMWHGPKATEWRRSNLGEVFGICFDPVGNIYVAATTIYYNSIPGGPGGSGAIYRLDGTTGAISTFATLPNSGDVGLGNIAWDAEHDQMFATNFEDGKIYRISSSGAIMSTYDPFTMDLGNAGLAPQNELIWGIGVYGDRVYFGRWRECTSHQAIGIQNEVWSIELQMTGEFNATINGAGDFAGNDQFEFSLPSYGTTDYSNPVSDIAFSGSGNMLVAERSVALTNVVKTGTMGISSGAHDARVLEYTKPLSTWVASGNTFSLGAYNSGLGNSAGGVDYAYGSYNTMIGEPQDCDDAMWASADALHFGNPYTDYIYGWQWLPATGGTVTNAVLIDADGNTTNGDKTEIGDIEVYKKCSPPDSCLDELLIEAEPTSTCCFSLKIGSFPAGYVNNITAKMLTPGTSFAGFAGPTNWNVFGGSNTVTWDSAGCIPQDTVTGLEFCIVATGGFNHQIEITYKLKDGTPCVDTITVECDPNPYSPCFSIVNEMIDCRDWGPRGWFYDLSFAVTSSSSYSNFWPAEHFSITPITPNVTITPNYVTFGSPVGFNATSGTLNYVVGGTGAIPGTQVCFVVQLHGPATWNGYQWQCPPDTFCIMLPDCGSPCDNMDVQISDGSVYQYGNTGATLSSTINVTPGQIIRAHATVMGVARSRVWCPNVGTGTRIPVTNPTLISGLITGATISPSMPLFSGLNPPSNEVIWGNVYSGVNMTGASTTLKLAFPNTNLGWRCIDTLTICVRYQFTDTDGLMCDTVVYYTLPRCGRPSLGVPGDPTGPVVWAPATIPVKTFDPPTSGGGYTLDEPLHSATATGPSLALSMSSHTTGTLTVSHWWTDLFPGVEKMRLTKMYVAAESGIAITGLQLSEGETIGTIGENVAEIDMNLSERETDDFDITFDNPNSTEYFTVWVAFDYVDTENEEETLTSREYLVYGDLTGGESIGVEEEERKTTTLYRLLIGANGAHSEGWIAPSCFRFIPPEGVSIVASGPMHNRSFSDFHVLRPMDRTNAILMPLPESTDMRGTVITKDDPLRLWLVLEGGEDLVDLDWEALDGTGSAITRGTLQLSATSTVRDDDGSIVAGGSIYLLEAFPNPSADRVTTRFNLFESEVVTIEVYDITGRLVRTVMENRPLSAGTHEYAIDLADRPDGVYYIRMSTGSGSQTRRLVKER